MDKNYDIAIEEIYIPSKHDKESYLCEDFIIFPEGKEKNGGYVFGIIEMRATPTAESEKIIQTIVNSLKENYYSQILSSPEPQKLNLETVFEYALQKTNDSITEMIQIGHIKLALENLNYLIAVAKPNPITKDINFFFTQQGLIQAFLLHKTKQNNFKTINIIDNTPKLKENGDSRIKIFSSTLSGKIFANDAIYVCSEIFSNYIPSHKVNKILSTNDMPSAIDYFKNLINNVKNNSYLTYCAIFVKMESMRSPNNKPISQKSIDALISTTVRTEKFLTPTFALNIKEWALKIIKLFKRSAPDKKLSAPKTQFKIKFGALKFLANALKIIFSSIGTISLNAVLFIAGHQKDKPNQGSIAEKQKSSAINRTILAIITVLVVALIFSVFIIRHIQQTKKEQIAYEAQIKKIQDELNNAQINLIYKNNDNSLILAKQAAEDIKNLPQATNAQKANFNELNQQLTAINEKLLNIFKLTPQLIAEITSGSQQPVALASIQLTNNQLFVTSQATALEIIDLGSKQTEAITSSAGDLFLSAQEDATLLFLTNQNKLLKYNFSDKTLKTQSISPSAATSINAVKLYNQNLYLLNAAGQQIIKYQATTDGFSNAQSWIKNKKDADLSQTIDLALDGNIYALTSAGAIYKFYAGNLIDFTVSPIEPKITEPQKILTKLDFKNIYLLDNAGKRIIAIDKSGRFIKQFIFDQFDLKIADFQISQNEEILYFIAGNKAYQAGIK